MAIESQLPPKNPLFVGRKGELDKIHELLREWRHGAVVKITGPGGVGKTALAREVVSREDKRLTPFWVSFRDSTQKPLAFREAFNRAFIRKADRGGRNGALVILDGVDEGPEEVLTDLVGVILNYKLVAGLILTSRNRIPLRGHDIHLAGLSSGAAREFLQRNQALSLTDHHIASLVNKTDGHPLALELVSRLLLHVHPLGLVHPVDQVLSLLDGEIYALRQTEESQIVQAVRPQIITFSGELANQLKHSPEKLHEVNSRQFEQLIADLFHDMGWEVELTQATRDGGRDILAHLNTGVVKLLCLIEAKKHRKDRPVGIQLVKNLYGTFCDEQANSAMLVTTSHFTRDAMKFRDRHKYQLSLKDYTDVVGWLANYNEPKKPI
jgi:restriction system protein